jgi:hypothetical protein
MNSVSKQRLDAKSEEVSSLNGATEDLLRSVKKKNNRALWAMIVAFSLLLLVGVVTLVFVLQGVNKQNALAKQTAELAQKNTDHIDCIIKSLSTPIPPGQEHRVIEYRLGECNIKFTK